MKAQGVSAKSSHGGCLVVSLVILGIGVLFLALGYLAGDRSSYDYETGLTSAVATPLYIIGGVFGGLGLLALFVTIAGGKPNQQGMRR